MEPLFSIESKYTEEEFVKFNRYVIFHNKHNYVTWGVMIGAVLIFFSAITSFGSLPVGFMIAVAAAWILVLIWSYTWGADRKARKYYAKDKVINGLAYKLSFFEDNLIQMQSNGSASLEY
ncbi:MAG: hypothetical protein IJ760_04480 [Bacteroidales bacterium]|nr:hypothetical protein [Bacteroidales bacterium]